MSIRKQYEEVLDVYFKELFDKSTSNPIATDKALDQLEAIHNREVERARIDEIEELAYYSFDKKKELVIEGIDMTRDEVLKRINQLKAKGEDYGEIQFR